MTDQPICNQILNGDCLALLPKIPAASVDFILTDPPYLARYRPRDGRRVPNDDRDAWLKPAFAELYRTLKHNSFCVSFYSWSSADRFLAAWRMAGFRILGHFVFPKRYSASVHYLRYQHECAYLLPRTTTSSPTRRSCSTTS